MIFKATILLVEDDREQAELVAETLSDEGYKVYHFPKADAAWEWLQGKHPVDLVISDRQMPGLSGTGLVALLRKHPATAELPILLFSVLGTENHKVDGLRVGADDYVTKPFSKKEFLARVAALLRRSKMTGAANMLSADGIEVDLDRAQVKVRGKAVELLPKEYALLVLFLQKRNHVLTQRFIAEAVWGLEDPASSATLKVWISNLRKKLGSEGERLQAVVNQGYRFD